MTDLLATLNCRRALEALRNGVPNRYAVEMLGCGQPAITGRFEAILGRVADQSSPSVRPLPTASWYRGISAPASPIC